MKPVFAALIFLALASVANANDASFEGIAGSARPLKGENPWIQMESEKVILTANAKDFTTQADFVFRNHSNRRLSVPMGFPEGNYGDVASAGPLQKSGFSSFATWVDGRKVVAKRTVLSEKAAQNADFDTYWLKTVEFAPLQTRRVRVVARSPYGGRAAWGLQNCLSYDFSGQNWRGNVEVSEFEVHVVQKGLWMAVMEAGGNKALDLEVETGPKRAILRRHWTNWPAKMSVSVGLQRAFPFWHAVALRVYNSYDIHFFRSAQTFRVGAKPKTLENYGDFAPDGFVRDGTTYVSLSLLKRRVEDEAKTKIALTYNAKKRQARLTRGRANWIFELDSTFIEIRSQGSCTSARVKLGAAPVLLHGNSGSTFYVPLNHVVQALNLSADMRATNRLLGAKVDAKNRLFTISLLPKK